MRLRIPRIGIVLVGLVLCSAAANAQTGGAPQADPASVPAPTPPPFRLVGRVFDMHERPLAAAEVRAGARAVLTDSAGDFRLDSLEADPTFILIRRVGYQPAETEIARQHDVVEIRIVVHLEPVAVELGTVVINERRLDVGLLRSGFYDRMNTGSGTFFTGEQLERMGHTYTAVLGAVPGVEIAYGAYGALVPLGMASGGLGRTKCPMDVYVDGMHVRWARETGINGVVPKEQLVGVEIYPRNTQVPAQYRQMARLADGGIVCGAIFLWTRPFAPKEDAQAR